jgi:cytochrome c556
MKPLVLTFAIAGILTAACNRQQAATVPAASPTITPSARTAAGASASNPQEIYEARRANFKEIGGSFQAINRELKSDAPDLARIRTEAAALAARAEQLPTWFPIGSGPDVVAATRAKQEIWTDSAGFRRAHETLLERARRLSQEAEGGDLAAIQAAGQALGGACGGCHQAFRGPERK